MSPLQNDRDREVYREGAKGRGGQEEQDLKHKLMHFEWSKREGEKKRLMMELVPDRETD